MTTQTKLDQNTGKTRKILCWEEFGCTNTKCPAYKSMSLRCWLYAGTHCHDQIQGKFIEKMEMCLNCIVFQKNMDTASLKKTLEVTKHQFNQFRQLVDERDKEAEAIGMELSIGLSEVFDALKKIASGDPTIRISETSEIELISKLKYMVNLTAQEIGEIVDLSHEFAIDLAEHFDVLHRVAKGDLSARVTGSSHGELSESLKKVTNEMIENIDHEIMERKRAETDLRKSEERYRSFLKNFQGIAFRGTLEFKPIFFHGAVEQITGHTSDEFMNGQIRWDQVLHPVDIDHIPGTDELKSIPNYAVAREYRIVRKDGKIRWVHEVIRNICDESGIPIRVEGAIYDITDRKLAQEKIVHMAFHDDLTGLPNRHLLKDRLDQAIKAAKHYNRFVATLFLDVDNFKRINDTLGHDSGDALLRSIAERLQDYVRKSDTIARSANDEIESTVARLGGDEFTVLLSEINTIQNAAQVAQRILDIIGQPFMIANHEVFITTSIGISIYPHDGIDAENLLKNADTAMYYAKDQGKNNFQFYAQHMNIAACNRFEMENKLRKALDNKEFHLYYQPQLDIRSGSVVGVEALIRWIDAQNNVVLPGAFISLAEETGLIVPIGEWVLHTACSQNKAWQDAGFPLMYVSVNISGIQFKQPSFISTVNNVLQDTGLDPHYLELELTESILMESTETAIQTLKELKSMGVRISIDDFGTGYSSLSYLKRFPIDTLKIDRSFVRDVTSDSDDKAIINAIIALARSLNLKVIAEGVETIQQLVCLHEQGSDGMQGYLFSPPLPVDSLTQLLTEGKNLKTWWVLS
ncbi:MAG TPA: EAL domain-containing protein [Thermodesulfovibrionales bacterium]|nr:EAL domain-containing protein [Thermodesulfovibrionales bacterium]